jgi:hypothetical protein
MINMKKGLSALFICVFIVGFSFTPEEAYACSCMQVTPEEKMDNADVVFSGKVIAVEREDDKVSSYKATAEVFFEVYNYWKHTGVPQQNVVLHTQQDAMCGFGIPAVGLEFLIYATKNDSSGSLSTNICSGNLTLAEADNDIESLGTPTAPEPASVDTSPALAMCDSSVEEKVFDLFEDNFPDYEYEKNRSWCTDQKSYYNLHLEGDIESAADIPYDWQLEFYVNTSFDEVSYENVVEYDDLKKFAKVIESSDSFDDHVIQSAVLYGGKNNHIYMKPGFGKNNMVSVGPLYYLVDSHSSLVAILSKDYIEKDPNEIENINLSKKGIDLLYSDKSFKEFKEDAYENYVPYMPTVPMPVITKNIFSRDLRTGDQGEDVLRLQKLLNQKGYTVAELGAGSVGNETTYFGPATRAALIRFQEAHALELGITQGTGYFGPLTRTLVN